MAVPRRRAGDRGFLLTEDEGGGRTFFTGTVDFIQSGCLSNGFGFNVCTETGSIAGLDLNAGGYWLNLQNAVVASGNPVYWDENDGPSEASETFSGYDSFRVIHHSGEQHKYDQHHEHYRDHAGAREFDAVLVGHLAVADVLRRKL